MKLEVETTIAAPRDDLFAFLADLENHWRLTGRGVEVVELAGPQGARTGGVVRLCGPLGIRRTVATQVVEVDAPSSMKGSARLGSGTEATVRWRLESLCGAKTRVLLEAEVSRVGLLDRLLLLAGGARWMRRLVVSVLSRLARVATSSEARDHASQSRRPRSSAAQARA
jgi:carbon monoxide dehydrogenase subunit G